MQSFHFVPYCSEKWNADGLRSDGDTSNRSHMKLTAGKYHCSDLGNPPQRAFASRTSMNLVIFFIYGES